MRSILRSKHKENHLARGRFLKRIALLGFVLSLLTASCSVDNSYDLSKDVDLTMALGSNGLALKLGSTQKMYLRDIIKTDESSLLDTIPSGGNRGLYYILKSGSSSFDVRVNSMTPFNIDPYEIQTGSLFTATESVSGVNFYKDTLVSGEGTFNARIKGIPTEVKEVHSVPVTNVSAVIRLSSDNSKFKIVSYRNLKIKFPDFVKSAYLNSDHEYVATGTASTISVPIERFELPVNGVFGQKVVNGVIDQSGVSTIDGNIVMSTNGTVNIAEGETAKVIFHVTFSTIAPQQITGLVDPSLSVNIDPMQIRSELPDFLKDDAIRFSVTNPTVKFRFNGQNLPFPLLFKAILESRINKQAIASVSIPQSGRVSIPKGIASVSYFSQASTPFDPNGIEASATKEVVPNMSSLITKLPEQIAVDLNGGKVVADQRVEHSIRLGQNYGVGVYYQVIIPFQFDKDLQILYTDSVVGMHKDLKDYQAEGATITATALNAIPLNLVVQVVPYGVDGKVISGIEVETTTIAAGTLDSPTPTEISVKFSPTTPAEVSKIDQLKFKFTASASNLADGQMLLSPQYVQLNNLRIKLNGKIITNFN